MDAAADLLPQIVEVAALRTGDIKCRDCPFLFPERGLDRALQDDNMWEP